MSMFITTVPRSIDANVVDLCRMIHPTNVPVFVRLRPEKDCIPLECFPNVKNKVSREGGRIVYGWSITQDSLLIEGEHHAVYEPPDSAEWIDITPPQDEVRFTETLFLPDEEAVEDSTGSIRRDNVRMPLIDDVRVDEIISMYALRNQIMNSVPGTGELKVSGERARLLIKIEENIAKLAMSIASDRTRNKVGRNDPCPCGSGTKFKKCCGR